MKKIIKIIAKYLASQGFQKEAYTLYKIANDNNVSVFNELFIEMLNDGTLDRVIRSFNRSGALSFQDEQDAIHQAYTNIRSTMDNDANLEPGRGYIITSLRTAMTDVLRKKPGLAGSTNRDRLGEATYTEAGGQGYGQVDTNPDDLIFRRQMERASEGLMNDEIMPRLIFLKNKYSRSEWFEKFLKEFPEAPGHEEYWDLKEDATLSPENMLRFKEHRKYLQDRYHKRIQRHEEIMRRIGGI